MGLYSFFIGMEIKLHLYCWGADPGLQPLLHRQVGSSHEGSVSAHTKLFKMLSKLNHSKTVFKSIYRNKITYSFYDIVNVLFPYQDYMYCTYGSFIFWLAPPPLVAHDIKVFIFKMRNLYFVLFCLFHTSLKKMWRSRLLRCKCSRNFSFTWCTVDACPATLR